MADTKAESRGSVIGGILLIAGSCVGAGMLGLPILTGVAGFFPTLIMLFAACIFMTTSGLMLVEVGGWFDKPPNFITMVTKMLGPLGGVLCWILYLFLFYALLVGYMALSGTHFSAIIGSYGATSQMAPWMGSLFFVVLFGWLIWMGTRSVDLFNRVLMFGKILAYLLLLAVGFEFVQPKLLEYTDVKYAFFSLPILVISFGFHNMIPTVSHYLGGDTKRVRMSIIGGSIFAFVIYLFWEIVVLGALPVGGEYGILESYKKGLDAAAALGLWTSSQLLATFAGALAFFAILTSFLAQSLSLVHFLGDGMGLKKKRKEPTWLCLLALIPPLICSVLFPGIFYKAINFAGGICAVTLFGIFPALMILIGRHKRNYSSEYVMKGGKGAIVFVFIFAIFIFFYQLTQMLGVKIFPVPS